MDQQTVKGVVIENKSGRQAILADVVVDATGDADVAFKAGASIDKLPQTGNLMAMIMLFRVGGVHYPKDRRICPTAFGRKQAGYRRTSWRI